MVQKKPKKSKKKIIIWAGAITVIIIGIGFLLAYKEEDIKEVFDDVVDQL